jgi:hypothetical protein
MERIQTVEPDALLLDAPMPDILRAASELYAQDRAEIERAEQRQGLKKAAAEAGLPPEYLERAAATLHAQRLTCLRKQGRRRRGMVAALALTLTVSIGFGVIRNHTGAVAVAVTSLAGKDLRGADLSHRNLAGQDLSGSNLRGAILTGTNLRGANLHSTDLIGADLCGADLSGAEMSFAHYSQSTRWPLDYVPQQHNAQFVGDSFPSLVPSQGSKP